MGLHGLQQGYLYLFYLFIIFIVELSETMSLAASKSVGRLELQNNFIVDDM
jgi:hypothetical protein